MSKITIPAGYRSYLDLYQTQTAIGFLKRSFEDNLSRRLNIKRVSAPLFLDPSSGLNDDLSGVERAVSFDIPATQGTGAVVHSLAKWKRLALYQYGFHPGEGLYADMNAIRRDEELDNLHSIYVDQWDWEKIITIRDRNEKYLQDTVISIVKALCDSQRDLREFFPFIPAVVERPVTFISAQELEDLYPDLSPKERENAFVRGHHTTFLTGIGGALRSGVPHDGRAPDYDDWSLNGDLLLYNPVLDCAMEISSMGIRVDPRALDRQLSAAGCDDRRTLPFHRMLLEGRLPLTIGGGIGQSRLCMLLLGKVHIGEVQASIWDEATLSACGEAGISLL